MNRIFGAMLYFLCVAGLTGVCGCGDSTNSVEMPANPEPAPGSPSAVGADAPAIGTPNDDE